MKFSTISNGNLISVLKRCLSRSFPIKNIFMSNDIYKLVQDLMFPSMVNLLILTRVMVMVGVSHHLQ